MRNVFKGFQVSHMAVPKIHEAKINQAYTTMHAPKPILRIRQEKPQVAKRARMPGRNPGIGR